MSGLLLYRGHGLTVGSELRLPELLAAVPDAAPDIEIRRVPHPVAMPDGTADFSFAVSGPQEAAIRIPGAGTARVSCGRRIEVWTAPDHDPALLRLFLIGSGLGMALHQRGVLVLHGATVLTPQGSAVVFVGESGAGKSTLAAALAEAGHTLLGDDTIAVWPGAAGPAVWPGSRVFKLWGETLRHLGAGTGDLPRVALRVDKFYAPNARPAPDRAVPLSGIVALEAAEGAPALAPVSPLEALDIVATQTYRPEFVPLLGREADHFRQAAWLAGSVPVERLTRPRDLALLPRTVALLEAVWRTPARVRA